MSKNAPAPALPPNAPTAGGVYRHYKGDSYRVVGLALHSDDTWNVVYEALYDGAVSKLFSRPVSEWRQMVEWEGRQVRRFVKI